MSNNQTTKGIAVAVGILIGIPVLTGIGALLFTFLAYAVCDGC
jgi:hypothetical protein